MRKIDQHMIGGVIGIFPVHRAKLWQTSNVFIAPGNPSVGLINPTTGEITTARSRNDLGMGVVSPLSVGVGAVDNTNISVGSNGQPTSIRGGEQDPQNPIDKDKSSLFSGSGAVPVKTCNTCRKY